MDIHQKREMRAEKKNNDNQEFFQCFHFVVKNDLWKTFI